MLAIIFPVVLTVVVAALGLSAAGEEGDGPGRVVGWAHGLLHGPFSQGRGSPAGGDGERGNSRHLPCACARLRAPSLPSC